MFKQDIDEMKGKKKTMFVEKNNGDLKLLGINRILKGLELIYNSIIMY